MSKAETASSKISPKTSPGEPATTPEEFIICVMARLLEGLGHVPGGALSPTPGCAALRAREVPRAGGGGAEVHRREHALGRKHHLYAGGGGA
mgnify:CR=1 FL=1